MDTSAEPSADTSADGRWVSYAELAAIRGIDHHSARRLTARQRWRRQKDNHGVVRVLVPFEHLKPERRARDMSADIPAGMSADASAITSADVSTDISAVIKPLEGAITTLREQLTVANARAEQAEARAAHAEQTVVKERVRADALRDRLGGLQAEFQQTQEDIEALRASIDELKAGEGRYAHELKQAHAEAEEAQRGAEARITSLETEAQTARGVAQEAVQAAETLRATVNELKAGQGRHAGELEQARVEAHKAAAARIASLETEAAGKIAHAEAAVDRARGVAQEAVQAAEALQATVDELKAEQAQMVDSHARDLAVARHDAEAAQQAAAELRQAEEARKGRGRIRRAWDGWRGR